MKLFQDNASIECLSAKIISRKIIPSSYMYISNVGKCFVYKCSRNSEAIILKELHPKEPKHNVNSALNLNDILEGENITVAIDTRRGPKVSKVGAHTGTHNAQTCTSEYFTFAMITKQVPSNPKANPPLQIETVPLKVEGS